MVHVLFLLAQEVRRYGVQAVARQLVVALQRHQQVELDAAVNGNLLVLARPIGLAAELRVPHLQPAAQRSTETMISCCRSATEGCKAVCGCPAWMSGTIAYAICHIAGPQSLSVVASRGGKQGSGIWICRAAAQPDSSRLWAEEKVQ